MSSEAARAHARAASREKAEGRCLDLECGHLYVPPTHLAMPKRRGQRFCDKCETYKKIVTHSRKHPDDCPGCAWCVDDPRELF